MSDIDALIVNFFTDDLTRAAAARLSPCSSVRVWDNSATLGAEDLSSEIQLFGTGENLMYAAASNRLFQHSTAPYILLVNPDALIGQDELNLLRDALENDDAAWGAAPQLVGLDGAAQNYRRRLPTLPSLLVDRLSFTRRIFRRIHERHFYLDDRADEEVVEQPAAACLLLRRRSLEGSLFDEGYPLFGNDTDLARRLNRSGHCCYVREAIVTHVGGASIAVAKTHHRAWIRAEYDRALRRYARRHIRGSAILEPIFAIRLILHRASSRLAGSAGAPVAAPAHAVDREKSIESRAPSAI